MFKLGELVLQLQTSNQIVCEKMEGAEVVNPIQIAVVSNTPQDDQNAILLHRSIGQTLLSCGVKTAAPPCGNGHLPPENCKMLHQSDAHNVLILVGDGATPIQYPVANWRNLGGITKVIPVLPEGISPGGIWPSLRYSIALSYKPKMIDRVAPDILEVAGVGVEDFRIFISYTQKDAKGIADSIFNALSEIRFDVYLDRFRGTPGRNFLIQIEEELADKACVLVLETPNIHKSSYARWEINYALMRRMGLMAIALPGSMPFRGIGPRGRLNLKNVRVNARNPNSTLNPPDLDAIKNFVRQNYMPQLLRRRRFQSNLMRYAAHMAKLPVPRLTGPLHKMSGGGSNYAVLTTPRLPRTGDFRQLDTYLEDKETGVIIGPLSHRTTRKFQDIVWTANKSETRLVEEAFAYAAMQRITQGNL